MEAQNVELQYCTLSFDIKILELLELQNLHWKKVFTDLDR